MTEPTRQWQMIKLGAGEYLLPSNDRSTLFLIHQYREEGDAYRGDTGKPIIGTYWEVSAIVLTLAEREYAIDPDPRSWEGWEHVTNMQRTRQDAIDTALTWTPT